MIKPIFGHKIGSFFTVFSFALHFSGTYGLLSLPFFLLLSVFGHETKKELDTFIARDQALKNTL
jgi:hypothetical protein